MTLAALGLTQKVGDAIIATTAPANPIRTNNGRPIRPPLRRMTRDDLDSVFRVFDFMDISPGSGMWLWGARAEMPTSRRAMGNLKFEDFRGRPQELAC